MKLLFLKQRSKTIFLSAIFVIFFSFSLPAQTKDLEYKKKGFQIGTELSALIAVSPDVIGAPGKLDFLIGYQFNPYFTLNLDLWTFWFVAYAVEINPKLNFTDSKFSPYLTATFGGGGSFLLGEDDNDSFTTFLTYSGGVGVDMHLWKKTTLFTELKYRGATDWSDTDDLVHGLEVGVGFRWTF